jgi:hypothetical protein
MEIAFCSQELRALFESAKAMNDKFGTDAAEALMTLLSELRAVDSVDELIDVDISAAVEGKNSVILSVNADASMRVEANHIKVPTTGNGDVAWERVYMIKIMGIQNGG